MSRLASWLTIAAVAFAATVGAPALAQSQFTAKVFDPKSKRPVQSLIEYATDDGKWHRLRRTDANGVLSSSCPGPVLRAIPEKWEYRNSHPKDCVSQVTLEVELRDPSVVVADLFEFGAKSSPIDRHDFAVAYVREVSNGVAVGPGTDEGDAVLLARYASDPGRLSRSEAERLETLALHRTEGEFERLDIDRDSRLSAAEIAAPTARGD